jgi:hypothetical protein
MGERSYADRLFGIAADEGVKVLGRAKLQKAGADADAEIAALRERVVELEAGLEASLPEHKAELSITHNEHRCSYESAAEFLDACAIDADELARPDEIERMIESDSIWCLQWYPHTPLGFNRRYAATLVALLGEEGDENG